jgi:hypothetical protein
MSPRCEAIRRAAEVLSDLTTASRVFGVPLIRLNDWLAGRAVPPIGAFLIAVDIIDRPIEGRVPVKRSCVR